MNLAQQHRRQQIAVRAVTLRQVLSIWPAFDITDIDRTWPAVQSALTALVWLRHRDSAAVAARYYRQARSAAGVTGSAPIQIATPPPVEQLAVSLTHVGPVGAKKLLAAGRKDTAAQTLVKVSGTVSRLVLNGGRETLTNTIATDRRARGYERVTSGNACDFCSMLASRGAVYGEESGSFEAHDHCSCTAEPVFA